MEPSTTDHDLGPLLFECRPTRRLISARRPQLLVHVLAVTVGVGFLAVSALAGRGGDRIGAGVTGLVLVASSALVVRPLVLTARCRVDVHEHGLACRSPGRGWILRWDRIDQLRARPLAFRLVARFDLVGLRVRLRSGGTTRGLAIAVGEHRNGAETIAAIHRARARSALPGVLAALDRGEVVRFGPLTASATGLVTERGPVDWDRGPDIRSDLGGIEVVVPAGSAAGEAASVALVSVELDRVPDYPVLVALGQVVTEQAGGTGRGPSTRGGANPTGRPPPRG